jgi:hypothetical protein
MFPRDMVCLRNISVNTLHKGDNDDDNDDGNNNNNNNNNNHRDNTRAVRRETKLALLNQCKINFILALLK